MLFSLKKTEYPVDIPATGKVDPTDLLQFTLGFENKEEKEAAETASCEIVISRSAEPDFGRGVACWDAKKSHGDRKKWNIYRVTAEFEKIPAGSVATFSVNVMWWRDVAREFTKAEKSITLHCFLIWENGDGKNADHFPARKDVKDPKQPVKLILKNGLGTGLALTADETCHKNGENRGFAHYETIKVGHASRSGMFGIVQWVRGVFVRWSDEKNYAYLKVPCCGENVDGYIPRHIPDGSTGLGIPNFFNVGTGEGTDKPGDSEKEVKAWSNFTHELMLLKFTTQVYLACDVNGAFKQKPIEAIADPRAKKAETIGDPIAFGPVDAILDSELRGATLKPFDSGEWTAGILQIKPGVGLHGGKGSAVTVGGGGNPVCAELGSEIPEFIRAIVRGAFAAGDRALKVEIG